MDGRLSIRDGACWSYCHHCQGIFRNYVTTIAVTLLSMMMTHFWFKFFWNV